MKDDKTLILKVLVGSQAHGLANENSDYDYRGVYVTPTKEILSLNHKYKGSHWLEGKEDQTSYEIGHFLQLATKCNPTILEVFKAPVEPITATGDKAYFHPLGLELRELFSYVWNPVDVFNAFTGYGLNQRKKMLDDKDNRWQKYAVAYLRTLSNLYWLLREGDFSLEVTDPDFKKLLLDIKEGRVPIDKMGGVVDLAREKTEKAREMLKVCTHEPDLEKVEEFLLKVRKENLE